MESDDTSGFWVKYKRPLKIMMILLIIATALLTVFSAGAVLIAVIVIWYLLTKNKLYKNQIKQAIVVINTGDIRSKEEYLKVIENYEDIGFFDYWFTPRKNMENTINDIVELSKVSYINVMHIYSYTYMIGGLVSKRDREYAKKLYDILIKKGFKVKNYC